jgi:acetoin:2,6-dichlorophenolindophenol oxidoreductase subunit beta
MSTGVSGQGAPPSDPVEGVTYREAIGAALADEMREDDRVVLFGEDVAKPGGVFKATEGLLEEFGPRRVRDTPIAEQALLGTATGLAAAGFRPVVELMFADFLANAMDQLANHTAKLRYMSGGRLEVPLVVRTVHGPGVRFGAQHSQSTTSWLLPFPGLKIVAPATVDDVYHLLRAAIRDPDPVVFIEHKRLYATKEAIDRREDHGRLGTATVRRAGSDLTLVALSGSVPTALEAAEELAAEGTEVEVVDLRGLVPLDLDTVLGSVRNTGRLLVAEEEPRQGGWAAHIVAAVAERAFGDLRSPPRRVSGADVPLPAAPALEDAAFPGAADVATAVRAMLAKER